MGRHTEYKDNFKELQTLLPGWCGGSPSICDEDSRAPRIWVLYQAIRDYLETRELFEISTRKERTEGLMGTTPGSAAPVPSRDP